MVREGFWKGKHLSDEHKEKLRISNVGKKHPDFSEEHKRKISETNKRLYREGKRISVCKGIKRGPLTDEQKRLISIRTKECMNAEVRNRLSKIKKEQFKNGLSSWNKGIKIDKIKYPNYFIRNKFSEESKEKMSISHKIYANKPENRERLRLQRLHQTIPTKDTSIEVALQNRLKELNVPFKTHVDLPGQPDIFIEPNICIFADGCFWHGCEDCFDKNKFPNWMLGRQAYDKLITAKLRNQNYVVLRFWEHGIENKLEDIVKVIVKECQQTVEKW